MIQILFNLCTIKGIDQTAQMVKRFVASIPSKQVFFRLSKLMNEPPCEKIGFRGFRPGATQTGQGRYRRWLVVTV